MTCTTAAFRHLCMHMRLFQWRPQCGSNGNGCRARLRKICSQQISLVYAELRNRSTSPSTRPGRLQQDIHVFVARHGSGRLEDVLSQEALNKVKIKLKLKGWSISNSSLVWFADWLCWIFLPT